MAGKPSSDWDTLQIEEWAFSVAALGWGRDEYWKASRSEYLEVKKMWMLVNGHTTKENTVKENAEAFNNILGGFGGTKVETDGTEHK